MTEQEYWQTRWNYERQLLDQLQEYKMAELKEWWRVKIEYDKAISELKDKNK